MVVMVFTLLLTMATVLKPITHTSLRHLLTLVITLLRELLLAVQVTLDIHSVPIFTLVL